jgi:YD repeat-containing protein
MLKYKLLFILSLGILASYGQNQNINLPKIMPASPEASALAKYLNYPISYATGLANISIPITQIQAGDLFLPISISYHHAGLKVNESSGWIGSSWSLQAEPSISRSQKGRADEDNGYMTNNLSYSTYPMDGGEFYNDLLVKGYQDEEPDEFYYRSLQGSSGFYFSRKPRSNDPYQIVTHPYQPVKIKYNNPKNWEMWDETGAHYQFGTDFAYTEYSMSGGITAWKAKKITSATTGDSISFSYHPYTDENVVNLIDTYVIEDSLSSPFIPFRTECSGGSDTEYFPIVKHLRGGYGDLYKVTNEGQFVYCGETSSSGVPTTILRTVKIKEIRFPNGKVTFEKDALGNLSFIKVYNEEMLVKQFRFFQSFYDSQSPGNPLKRSKLDAVEIQDANGNVIGRYAFDYNTSIMVPTRDSRSQDFWGYFNDISNEEKGLVPPISVSAINFQGTMGGQRRLTFEIGGANRWASDAMKAGVLTRITYPSGGYTEFEYQTNKHWDYDYNYLKAAGGLRIYKVRDYDPVTNKKMVRLYKYGKDENGAGFIKHKITPEEFMSEQLNSYRIATNSQFNPIVAYTTRLRTYACNTLTDLFYSNGAPVVYDQVTEYQIDESTQENLGKTIYKYNYNNPWFETSGRIPGTTLTFYPRNEWMRGNLLSKEDYKINPDQQYDLVKKVSYTYGLYNLNTIPVGKAYKRINLIYEDNAHPNNPYGYVYLPYTLQTGSLQLDGETTLIKNGSQEFQTTRHYTYNNLVNLKATETTVTGSDGKVTKTVNKYPNDVMLTGSAELGRLKLLDNWQVNTLLEQSETKGESTRRTKTEYNVFHDRALPAQVLTNTGANYIADQPRLRYHAYNTHGNLLSVSKEDDTRMAYLWGYNNQYPVAEARDAEQNEILFVDFENVSGATAGVAHTGKKFWSGDYTVNFTRPNSKPYTISYWYRLSGVWKLAEQAYTTSSIALTLGDAIDDVRIFPSSSQMTTYTYTPLIGITSSTDANNKTTYYEYDPTGRLMNIKDHEGNIVNKLRYKYAGVSNQYYYNDEKSQAFARNNCSSDAVGSTVNYTVWAGKYASLVSKADANQKAQEDINANGQAYANENGSCVYYSDYKQRRFYRNNCGGPAGDLLYTIVANKYTSLISKEDANQKAEQELNTQGQTKANQQAPCYNTDVSRYFSTENCGPNEEPVPMYINIPERSFHSMVSTQDANNMAIHIWQATVNGTGQCKPVMITLEYIKPSTGYRVWLKNTSTHEEYDFSMDEPPGQVPYGTYYITISPQMINHKYSTGCNPPQTNNVFYNIPVHDGCRTMYISVN